MATVQVRTAMRQLDAPKEEILRWAGRPDDTSEHARVDIDEIRAARDAEKAEQQRMDAETAQQGAPQKATAARRRQSRTSKRVKLDFSLLPQDRQELREIQQWVDEQRQRVSWEPEPGWQPEKRKRGDAEGTISYQTPVGWVENVPVDEFRQMAQGLIKWAVPSPDPSYSEMRSMANRLEALSFQAKECRLCRRPIESGNGPEMAQLRKLLNGRFVLPYINHSLEPGQEELRFRRMHMLHAVWEDELTSTVLMHNIADLTTSQLADMLYDSVPRVLKEAQKRKPGTTEDDVYEALDQVLEIWEQDQNAGTEAVNG